LDVRSIEYIDHHDRRGVRLHPRRDGGHLPGWTRSSPVWLPTFSCRT
jgi:hypothetical protein